MLFKILSNSNLQKTAKNQLSKNQLLIVNSTKPIDPIDLSGFSGLGFINHSQFNYSQLISFSYKNHSKISLSLPNHNAKYPNEIAFIPPNTMFLSNTKHSIFSLGAIQTHVKIDILYPSYTSSPEFTITSSNSNIISFLSYKNATVSASQLLHEFIHNITSKVGSHMMKEYSVYLAYTNSCNNVIMGKVLASSTRKGIVLVDLNHLENTCARFVVFNNEFGIDSKTNLDFETFNSEPRDLKGKLVINIATDSFYNPGILHDVEEDKDVDSMEIFSDTGVNIGGEICKVVGSRVVVEEV